MRLAEGVIKISIFFSLYRAHYPFTELQVENNTIMTVFAQFIPGRVPCNISKKLLIPKGHHLAFNNITP